jgi:hypothetical protein
MFDSIQEVSVLGSLPLTGARYKVSFQNGSKRAQSKVLGGRQVARAAAGARLPVGARCIGRYQEGEPAGFYSGVIGEVRPARYLVFFDDGFASYLGHGDVRRVCEASAEVWKDVHPDTSGFIQQFMERGQAGRLLELAVGRRVEALWQGIWEEARVARLDASLAKLAFPMPRQGRPAWVYRGSPRLRLLAGLPEGDKVEKGGKVEMGKKRKADDSSVPQKMILKISRESTKEVEEKKLLESPDVTCVLCQKVMKSCSAYKKHLCNATHYQQQLIQYVQETPDGGLSCAECPYTSLSLSDTSLHVGTVHRRLQDVAPAAVLRSVPGWTSEEVAAAGPPVGLEADGDGAIDTEKRSWLRIVYEENVKQV